MTPASKRLLNGFPKPIRSMRIQECRRNWDIAAYTTTTTRWPRRSTVAEVDILVDAEGKKHDWRAELFEALKKRQKADGSWVNENDRWLEGEPNLVTGYVMMTLSHCKPKK